jgi:hypothetical protein
MKKFSFFTFAVFVSMLSASTEGFAGTVFGTCRATRILDTWIFEEKLDTLGNSKIILTETAAGYRFFIGAATYENWEHCNIEQMKPNLPAGVFDFRIDDYKQDLTLYLETYPNTDGGKHGMITVQLNPAKPATAVAEITCD